MRTVLVSLFLVLASFLFVSKAYSVDHYGINCTPAAHGQNYQTWTCITTQNAAFYHDTPYDDGSFADGVTIGSTSTTVLYTTQTETFTVTCHTEYNGQFAPSTDANGNKAQTIGYIKISQHWGIYPYFWVENYSLISCTGIDPAALNYTPVPTPPDLYVYVGNPYIGWVSCLMDWTHGGFCDIAGFDPYYSIAYLP